MPGELSAILGAGTTVLLGWIAKVVRDASKTLERVDERSEQNRNLITGEDVPHDDLFDRVDDIEKQLDRLDDRRSSNP